LLDCALLMGNPTTMTIGGQHGNFELNVMMPVMARNLLESIRLLSGASRVLADRCVSGLTANEVFCRSYAEGSPATLDEPQIEMSLDG
jgi:fumarate hydratase, class II